MLENRKVMAGEKIAAYLGTRNLYGDMVTAVKSLFCNSDVDRVFFVIEDDEFPYPLPKEVEILNQRNQQWFLPSSPNYGSHFSYLCVARAAYAQIFRQFDRILSLDDDTVIVDDISGLWDTDLQGNYCAGVIDRGIGRPGYFNAGVILMDLKKIREDGIDDKMVKMLNRQKCLYIDQDALNACCGGKILELPLRYNESPVTGNTLRPAVIHYVGQDKKGGRNAARRYVWNTFKDVTWETVKGIREERYHKTLTF